MPPPRERDISKELERAIARLPRIDTHPFWSELNPIYTSEHLILSQTPANLLLALNRAREARGIAISYRDFTVGASVVGLKANPSFLQFISGINIKPEEDSVINIHAEQLALTKLEEDGFDMVSMIAIVGELQADQQSGKTMHTLHPCGLCRKVLLSSPIMDGELTLIVTALPDFSVIEVSNLTGLQRFHELGDDSGITRFHFDTPLKILTPYDGSVPADLRLLDTPEALAEEREWDRIIGDPLIKRLHRLIGQRAASQA